MKKIVLLVLGLLFLSGYAAAYEVNINTPDTLTLGEPLVVTGTTTFGIGTPIDVVLYYQLTTATEIKRKTVYVQSDKTFEAVFDTTDLNAGTYKVEVPVNGMGASVTMRQIQLVDRSGDLDLASPVTQNFSGSVYVAGTIKGMINSGVQIVVIGPDNLVIYGPQYVNTNNGGDFSTDVPITEPGEYEVSFTDSRGLVSTRVISVISQLSQTGTSDETSAPDSLEVSAQAGNVSQMTPVETQKSSEVAAFSAMGAGAATFLFCACRK
jgi:YbbR domain-containing protein